MKRIACLVLFITFAASITPVPSLNAQATAPDDAEKAAVEAKMKELAMAKGVVSAILHPVNDYANILSPLEENRIAKMLIDHRNKTGVQIAILTVRSTGQVSIEEFSLKVAEKWGGGDRKRDDGLLFTVAVYDRRMRIEVGYGLEGYVTDIRAGRILDGIRDDFRANRYGQGIEKAVAQIIDATAECRPGQAPPISVRLMGALSHIPGNFILFFILGAVVAAGFLLVKWRLKFPLKVSVPAALFLYLVIPVLLQVFLSVFWVWIPVVYLTGALAGASVMGAIKVNAPKKIKKKKKVKKHQEKQESRVSQVVGAVLTALPAMGSLAAIYYFLHVQQPSQADTTKNETFCLVILAMTNLIQGFIMIAVNGGFGSGESSDSYSSYTSSSSSGYSSSDSSNDTSWSGGGGGFGGGGASSSW